MAYKGSKTGSGSYWNRAGTGRVHASRAGGRKQRGPGKFSGTNAKAGLGGPTGRSPGRVRRGVNLIATRG